jgi:transposase
MNILDLDSLDILETKLTEHGYVISAVNTIPPIACTDCEKCGVKFVKHGTKKQAFMDTPMHGKRVAIVLKRQRYKCPSCGKTILEPLWGMNSSRMCTNRCVEYIEQQSLKRTFVQVADEIGVSEGTIRNIFRDYVERLEEENKFVTPRWMGIDEIHLLGKPRGVITDIESGVMLDLLRERSKEFMVNYLKNLPEKERIEIVTMDMWNPYRLAVHEVLPLAAIVVDKFHVVKMANKAVDDIRKKLRSELSDKERKQLKNDKYTMLKRRNTLSPMQEIILQSWLLNFPTLRQAYDIKESYFEVWEAPNEQEARKRYKAWEKSIPSEMKFAFKDLITATHNWDQEIFAYFTYRVTNAYTESVNSLIRSVHRMGRGYSFEAIRAKMLFSEGLHKMGRKSRRKYMFEHFAMQAPGVGEEVSEYEAGYWKLGVDISTLVQWIEEGKL